MKVDPRTDVENRLQSLLDERFAGLSRRIQEWLDESHARAGSLAEIIKEARREPLLLDTRPDTNPPAFTQEAGDLAAFAREVEAAADQVAILGHLVSGAASRASRVVLFVVRNETFTGWAARGFAAGFDAKKLALSGSRDTLLSRSRLACAPMVESSSNSTGFDELAGVLSGEAPIQMMAAPLWVRDRVVAVLYADTSEPAVAWAPDMIRVMVSLAALSLEAIPIRVKFPRPLVAAAAITPEVPAPARAASRPPAATTLAPNPATAAASAAPPASEIDPEAARVQEDARRFARLLVSEILLYNEKDIEEGRRDKDLYERLKEDIDRSRQMYLNRVSSRLSGGPDYFLQELVRTLAEGDESALTVPWG